MNIKPHFIRLEKLQVDDIQKFPVFLSLLFLWPKFRYVTIFPVTLSSMWRIVCESHHFEETMAIVHVPGTIRLLYEEFDGITINSIGIRSRKNEFVNYIQKKKKKTLIKRQTIYKVTE